MRLAALCLTMSTVAFLERGLVLTLTVYVGISIIQVLISLMSRSAAGVLIVWRGTGHYGGGRYGGGHYGGGRYGGGRYGGNLPLGGHYGGSILPYNQYIFICT